MNRFMRARWVVLVVVAAAALAIAATAGAKRQAGTITIGWAFDSTGNMAPFDGPALAAAKIRVAAVNAAGGVMGKRLVIKTCDTQGNKPAVSKACADKLLAGGANVLFSTCDVDYAAPAVTEALNRGVLAIAPCIGTDQMGPKRFGPKGRLAFSFGNLAQDEGSAMAEYAYNRGWRTAAIATDTVIVYFKDVTAAFKARFTQLGGKVVDEETYQSGAGTNINNVVSKFLTVKADVFVTSTAGAFGALSTFVSGIRSAGNSTPFLNSWAGDGNYWLPKSPKVTSYYFLTFASAFGNDPVPAVNKLAKQIKAGTGGFITGPAAVDGLVTAIRRAKGSTNGAVLAAQMEKFKKVPTLSGNVSFSKTLHTVYGRKYRVMLIQDNQVKYIGEQVAHAIPKIK